MSQLKLKENAYSPRQARENANYTHSVYSPDDFFRITVVNGVDVLTEF